MPHPSDGLAAQLLAFWFGVPGSPEWNDMRPEWFGKSPGFDARVREAFLPAWESACAGQGGAPVSPAPAMTSPDAAAAALERCARILLLDQVPRNVFRGDPRSFATDAAALAIAQAMVETGQDRLLPTPFHRMFCYMPFEHAESMAAQDAAVRLMTALREETGGQVDVVEWAEKHRHVIARFGRFPHRNAVLGRATTDEEAGFLQDPAYRF